ncbi:armadillo-type protein [Mycena pura]|uniref:Armadillo-type protein n=1 Tax=Mycena pura TaxID=153505 RepID=A0AAD6XVZ5_9AGAR|nr:armadillo-type protein [Mycena pura]
MSLLGYDDFPDVGSEVLSSLAQNDKYRDKIKEKFPKVLDLLLGSHHKEQERSAALSLAKQMGAETDLILEIVVKELVSPDWCTRVAGLETVMELIKTDQLPRAAEKVVKGIMSCAEFPDEDVQLAVIRTLHELVKHDRFQDIKDNMPHIIKLLADDDASVREAVVDFLAEIATKDTLRPAINMNIPAIVANYVEADSETCAINKAFAGVSKWLSDDDVNVQKGALNAVAVGLKTEKYLPMLKNWKVIPEITKMVNNEEEDHDVRIAALQTCSSITQIKQGQKRMEAPFVSRLIFNLAAAFRDIMENFVPQIMAAFSDASWQLQIVMLQTITVFAQTGQSLVKQSFSEIVSDTTVDEILRHLSNCNYDDVRVQFLDTLEKFVSMDSFRGKIRDHAATIMPLLEDRSWTVQQAALRTFAVFAEHDIIRVSDNGITSRIISLLSGGDRYRDVCAGVLKILFNAAKRGVPPAMYWSTVVKYSLVHENWQVRVAALQVLENLADNPGHETIDTPTQEILDCLSKDQEELRVAVLRTLPKFIDNKFLERVHATETLPEITLSLLKSKSEDIRLSVIRVISDMVTKTELYPAIDAAIGYMATLLNTTGSEDEKTRATIWNTVRSLINTEEYYQTSMAFAEALQNILQAPLLSDPPTDVRMAAFGIIPAISKYSEFSEVVSGLLPVLVKAALKDDGIGEYDTIFRIKALQALSDIGTTQDTFRSKIDAQMAGNYTRGAKDRTLGRAVPKTVVDEVVVDIIDMLQHDENNVRMAGLQFITLPVVKEISLNPDKLVPTLVNLLSDWQEDIRTAVLRILSDLTKQEKFRVVFNRTLSALLEDLKGNDMEKKVTALKIWAALAQDETFRDIISGAAAKLATCFQDPEDQVRLTALAAFSQFEAFRLKAVPSILLALEGPAWHIRLQAIKQLAKLAENETYRKSIQGAFQAAGISTIVGLMSDSFKHVRIGALRLLPKVVELGNHPVMARHFQNTNKFADPPLNPTTIHCSLLKLLSDNDSDVCIAALEAITTLVQQCANSTSEIPRLIQLLKSHNLDHKMRSAALLTLSASIKKTVSVETVMDVVPVLCSVFTDTEDEECWSAAAQVALRLASQGTPVDNKILTILTSALQHENWHVCVAGLNILSDLIKQEPLAAEIFRNIPLPMISSLLEHSEKNVRVSAMHLIVSLGESQVEPEAKATLCAAIQGVWRKTFDDLESARPNNTNPTRSIYVAALENLTKLADFGTGTDWLPDNTELSRAVGHIIADVKDQTQSNQLRGVRALSKLADNLNGQDMFLLTIVWLSDLLANSRESLTCAVPKMTPLLSSNHTEIQLEVLGIFLKLVQHDSEQKVRSAITKEVSDIIPVLVNREPRVRAAGLSVLFKVAEELEGFVRPL